MPGKRQWLGVLSLVIILVALVACAVPRSFTTPTSGTATAKPAQVVTAATPNVLAPPSPATSRTAPVVEADDEPDDPPCPMTERGCDLRSAAR